jgi:hypothetical protein
VNESAIGCARSAVSRQRGQAMILVAMFLTALMLSFLILFNISQLNIDKVKVQNAADAVAYSSAILEARHLNFVAYTNRAMIANEVAIGQTIGLVTWLQKWGGTFTTLANLSRQLAAIPIAGPPISAALQTFFNVLANAVKRFSDVMAKFANVYAKLVSGFNTFIGYSQVAFRVGTYESMLVISGSMQQASNDIGIPAAIRNLVTRGEPGLIQRNAPGARIGSVSQFVQFMNMFLFEKYNKGCKPADGLRGSPTNAELDENLDCMKQMAAAVNDSRDLWSEDRSNSKLVTPPIPPLIVDIPILGKFGLNDFSFGLQQHGGSTLRFISGSGPSSHRGHFNWSSMDASALQVRIGIYLFSKLIRIDPELPMGWGTMQMSHKDRKDKQDYKLATAPLPTVANGGTELLAAGWNAAYGQTWDMIPATSFMASTGIAPPPLWGTGEQTLKEGSYGDLAPFHTIDPDYASRSISNFTVNLKMLAPPPFVVWVYMPEKETHTSDNLRNSTNNPAGDLVLDNMSAGDSSNDAVRLPPPFSQKPGMQAIASAGVYYQRFDYSHPDGDEDGDGTIDDPEEANAFSPYWSARLVAVDNMVLLAAMTSQEPSLAWAFSGVQQSTMALAGDSENIKDDMLDEMEDGIDNLPAIIEQVIVDGAKGLFGL